MSLSPFREIPSVEKLLQALGPLDLPRPLATSAVRRELAVLRADKTLSAPGFEEVLARIRVALDQLRASRLQTVINGTGVLLHTNLGRAPLARPAIDALVSIGSHYSHLEYDLATGDRGNRASYLEHCVALICGAEAATVVNNCAAALVLMLKYFTRGEKKEVLISRGELIQIGGGFRIPEILAASGARLREIGTTNHTVLDDYATALSPDTALILKVHRSNFYQVGFTGTPQVWDLSLLARKRRIPLAEDLGSGAIADTNEQGLMEHERTPAEAIRDGVDLVCFSGDKLLGGPQAGLIAGRARRVAALKREPFFRALRCDKLVSAAMQATVEMYLGGSEREIPSLAMIRMDKKMLFHRAESILAGLDGLPLDVRIGEGDSQVGGGTMPGSSLPSVTIDLHPADGMTLDSCTAKLRAASPPVIGYISHGSLRLDLRTIFPSQDDGLVRTIRMLFTAPVVH